jgi:hypothetical protein
MCVVYIYITWLWLFPKHAVELGLLTLYRSFVASRHCKQGGTLLPTQPPLPPSPRPVPPSPTLSHPHHPYFIAIVLAGMWTSIKLGFATGLVGVIVYAGYTIITTLLPLGASSNAIMRKASDVVLADPEVHNAFGASKTYGLDPGGRAEGRRYFVPEYKYEDNISGEK